MDSRTLTLVSLIQLFSFSVSCPINGNLVECAESYGAKMVSNLIAKAQLNDSYFVKAGEYMTTPTWN